MSYAIQIKKKALKELEALPTKVNLQIVSAIDALSENPRPKGSKKLQGEKEYLWRIRVGDYRIIYFIEDKIQVVEIRKITHRRSAYK